MHQLIRNDKTEKPPPGSVSSTPSYSPVLRPDDAHRGLDSPHSQTGMLRHFLFFPFISTFVNKLTTKILPHNFNLAIFNSKKIKPRAPKKKKKKHKT